MDYPKSVPGVGLVDGQFVDEDQVNGTPGSLIPAQWGNDVTEEILNVVREVGDVPAEASKNQLVGAIWKMFRSATAVATEALRGVLRVGTQEEIDAGALDDVAVTPKKLLAGFSIGLVGASKHLALPQWLGGLKIQWGTVGTTPSGGSVTFPVAFNNPPVALTTVDGGSGGSVYGSQPQNISNTGMLVYAFTSTNGAGATTNTYWLAIGK